MHTLFGDILTHSLAVAFSPEPILAVILMLFTPRARSNSIAFLIGWLAGILIVITIVLTSGIFISDQVAERGGSDLVGWLKLAVGIILLALAVRRWRKRPRANDIIVEPAWLSIVERFGVFRSVAVGILLSGINPKNLILTLLSASHIAEARLSVMGQIGASAAFVAVACATVAGPIAAYFVMGKRADPHLHSMRRWLVTNNNTILFVIFLVFGAKFVGNGLGVLIG